jgi:leucyl/phenylalanyl-tRNA---protein transferase
MKLCAEKLVKFPDPRCAVEGIVDMSDDLRVERLVEAYSFGIFPWPHEDLPTLWYSPEERGILDFADFHVPRSLEKFMRKSEFTYSFDQAFEAVIEECALLPRKGQSGTWITQKLLRAYRDFHSAGYAHSIEVWRGEDLVGGLYGVYVGGVFCGESMFHTEANVSKLALVKLVQFLKGQGQTWMDIQMVTPLLEQFGGKYVSREEFLQRLEKTKPHARPVDFKGSTI